jgi:hypothetical protein
MYVQYRYKNSNYWSGFGGRINPGRNYAMFGILAGVRREFPESFEAKGLPTHELSYQCNGDLYLYISDDGKEEGHTTLERALDWNKRYGCKFVNDSNGKPMKVQHPDWHSHSWMNVKELSKAYRTYFKMVKKEYGTGSVPAEYKAVLDVMKSLEKNGDYITKVVFWFDN